MRVEDTSGLVPDRPGWRFGQVRRVWSGFGWETVVTAFRADSARPGVRVVLAGRDHPADVVAAAVVAAIDDHHPPEPSVVAIDPSTAR